MVIRFPYDDKQALIPEIRQWHEEEHGEPMGDLAAERLLDWFLRRVGPKIYNQAIGDIHVWMTSRMELVANEIFELELPPPDEERAISKEKIS